MPDVRRLLAPTTLIALVTLASPAWAETVERNTPPAFVPSGTSVALAGTSVEDADSTPLGVNLAGIRLIGATEAVDESGFNLPEIRGYRKR